jgi:hypothetical protein
MGPSAQMTSELLKVIIEDKKNTDQAAREVYEQVEDGEKILDAANTSSVLNTVLSTINNIIEHKCLNEQVRLLKAHPLGQLTDGHVASYNY